MIRLGDIAKITAGQAAPKHFSDKGYPFIRAGHLEKLIAGDKLKNLPKVSKEVAEKKRLKLIPKGTILFAKSGMSATKNRVYITEEKCYFVSHLAGILPSEKFSTPYLSRFFLWYNPSKLILDSAYPSIRLEDINNLKIPLPPIEDQKKIAAILDAADSYRQKTKALITKYDELTQSLFLDMFGDPFEGDTCALKDNINIVGGYAFKSKDFIKEGIPLIKIGTVNKGYFEIENFSFLPSTFLDSHSKWIVKPGDILMSLTGTVGKKDYGNVEIATDNYDSYLLNQRVAKIEPLNDVYLKEFLFGLFSNNKTKTEITKISRGVRQANISNKDIENLKMITPSIKDQEKYLYTIKSIESQKAKAQESLQKAEELFNSLMQKAFKGELT